MMREITRIKNNKIFLKRIKIDLNMFLVLQNLQISNLVSNKKFWSLIIFFLLVLSISLALCHHPMENINGCDKKIKKQKKNPKVL